ncbi:hypothetical protein E2C01_026616 [Portunus trituberculatus]|uniref:Uncharacterized protein n=1 Tax=Portunus trituberculatus TaxID=210409 RepID=A0A5B7EG12_PORTR|nr:hypothetical protein [Portunus trituberculatus]
MTRGCGKICRKEELVAVRQQCEGRTEVVESKVDGRPYPLVVNTGATKTIVWEVVAAHVCKTDHCKMLRVPVVSMITMVGVEEMLSVFVADMEEPCLLGMDLLVQSAACVDLGGM